MRKGLRVLRARPVPKVPPVLKVKPARKENRGRMVPTDWMERPVPKARKVLKARKVRQVLLGLLRLSFGLPQAKPDPCMTTSLPSLVPKAQPARKVPKAIPELTVRQVHKAKRATLPMPCGSP